MMHHSNIGSAVDRAHSVVLCVLICVSLLATAHGQSRGAQPLDQMIEALGGQTFLDVDDIHTTGRFFGFSRGELKSGDTFSDFIKFPDMERTEFGGPKYKTIQINRGKQGMKVEGKKDPVE